MANLIKWLPNLESDIKSYDIERSTSSTSGFTLLVNIVHNLSNTAVFNGTHFFYNDTTGTNAHFYRLISIDNANNRSAASAAFQPTSAPPAPFTEGVGINQNYGSINNLLPVDSGGKPIDLVQIRIYKKSAP